MNVSIPALCGNNNVRYSVKSLEYCVTKFKIKMIIIVQTYPVRDGTMKLVIEL